MRRGGGASGNDPAAAGCEPGGTMSRLMALVAISLAIMAANAASAADRLVLQLNGPAQFRFAGYYAALWQGYYRDAGLAVEIKPGSGRGDAPIDPVREVTEGRAQFGTGTAELIVRTAQGLPLLLLAPIFQQSGAGMYYRTDATLASPGALAKAKVGRLPASDILDIELATALRAEGIEPDKLKAVPLQPGESVAALAAGSVDAVPGSAWELPWLAHEKGFAVKSFNPADYRAEFYGDTLFTLQRLARTDPALVRGFRAASLKGWEYALTHPDETAARLVSELPRPPGIADAGASPAIRPNSRCCWRATRRSRSGTRTRRAGTVSRRACSRWARCCAPPRPRISSTIPIGKCEREPTCAPSA